MAPIIVLNIILFILMRLMAKQRKLIYDNKDRIERVNAAKEARDIVLDTWQHDWDCTEKGRWTRRLIGQIRRGLNASMVVISFYFFLYLFI